MTSLQTYGTFRPTAFDPAGAFLREQSGWLLAPVSQTRDSNELDQSNFAEALKMLGGESETVEVHRFGHWGPGWFEIILIDPSDAERVRVAEEIAEALENYPVLNETDYSEREWESFLQGWEDYGRQDFIRKLEKDFDLPEAAVYILEDADSDALREFFSDHAGEPYYSDSSGVCINVRSWRGSKSDIAAFLRAHK